MPLINWNEKLELNITAIDQEHIKLVNLVNKLYEAMAAGMADNVLGTIFDGLIEYTKMHFFNEEKLMAKHGYPSILMHQMEHQKLTQKVQELQKDFNSGKTALSIKTGEFLRDWLANHIMTTDKKAAQWLKSKGVR